MIDNSDFEGLFTENEINDAKNNFFDILGQLYNGETLQILLSDMEKDLTDETKAVLPGGIEETLEIKMNKNSKLFNLILNLFIDLLIKLNPRREEADSLYQLKISILTVICLNGTITTQNNYKISDIKFDKEYIAKNKGKISDNNLKIIEKVIAYFPLACNFVAFGTINYVKFNHHFPVEKTHLIKKALLSFDPQIVDDIIESENKDVFYDTLVAAARVNSEFLFYEKVLNKEMSKLHDSKFRYYRILGFLPNEFKEDVVNIRRNCTPNGFIILDLISALIEDLKAKNVLFLLPEKEIFAKLLSLRDHLRANPFEYHPSKIIYGVMAKDFDEIHKKFLSYMGVIGGFIYTYTSTMEDSVIQAKCRLKYKNKVNLKDEKIAKFINTVASQEIKFKDKDVGVLKEKLNTYDIEINEDIDIELENNKAYEMIKNKDIKF